MAATLSRHALTIRDCFEPERVEDANRAFLEYSSRWSAQAAEYGALHSYLLASCFLSSWCQFAPLRLCHPTTGRRIFDPKDNVRLGGGIAGVLILAADIGARNRKVPVKRPAHEKLKTLIERLERNPEVEIEEIARLLSQVYDPTIG